MKTAHQPGLPVYDHRPGSGPTLVFLHYWGGSARTWEPVVERLAGRDTLTLDFRGWGRSRSLPGPYGLERLAEDTLAVLADAGRTDYVLVGHSMGGKVAQLVAAARPAGLRGVVLVGSGPARPPAHVTPAYREALSHAYDSDDSVAEARDHVLTAAGLPGPLASQVVADSRSGAAAARTEWPLHGIAEDITGPARRIEVPVLVVAGETDRVEPVDVLRDHLMPYLAHARLVVVPHTGHLIPLEAPAELAAAVGRFAPQEGAAPASARSGAVPGTARAVSRR
ncbi:alpha/beta fold hydrolase [Streptomyces fuscigenes]|uniref:alpha/beta fold hydrolase n=1 Tax=Streptomyces fuscigenes TaxID=1528880 RepID=UPI001F2886F2|nr:alpha/beta hydrolase [Streptomyces fuscigenes]MCF3962459.1 alpha/beta hydrolase [Streptomyces fuscigenes]